MKCAPEMEFSKQQERVSFLHFTVLVLSAYVLGAMLALAVFTFPPSVHLFMERVDFIVCLVFLADFVVRLCHAPSKLAFLRWGWIDLLASVPAVDFCGQDGSCASSESSGFCALLDPLDT